MITSRTFLTPEASQPYLDRCLAAGLFAANGVLREMYRNPRQYFSGESKLLMQLENHEVISVVHVAQRNYFNRAHLEKRLALSCYGMVTAYTRREMRRRGLASTLLARLYDDNPDVTFGMMVGLSGLLRGEHCTRVRGIVIFG